MSKLFIEDSTLSAIGDAIRSKAGTTGLIAPGNMPGMILNLPSGGGGTPVVTNTHYSTDTAGNYIYLPDDKSKFVTTLVYVRCPRYLSSGKLSSSDTWMIIDVENDEYVMRFLVTNANLTGYYGVYAPEEYGGTDTAEYRFDSVASERYIINSNIKYSSWAGWVDATQAKDTFKLLAQYRVEVE